MNIDKLHNIWSIESKHIVADEFTGYEYVYDQLDTLTKEVYDKAPEGTMDCEFDIDRSSGLVPRVDYT